ncbi:MAG: T9SS type A sorting domain-containing protein, partial [Flavobacteriales bacterium]|nr:T9SS type A sorting domain-containing protein [Flavobacteriales bacterium]
NNGWPAITCSGDNVACVDTGCETPSLILDGPATICQDQTTTVDIPEPATFPDGGGIRLQFISTATGTGINLTLGGGLPYTFDYDLNGLLSANDIDPFEGEYTINIFLFTDADDIAGTICASGEDPVTVTFLGADDPLCDESAENCSASPLIVEGDSEICAGETTTLTAAVPPEIPVGGGMLYQFVNVDDEEDVITWTGAPFPATFDNDLNGLLSDNDFDPFSGTYEVEIFIFTDADDIAGSLCAFGNAPVTLTFLDAGDPLCQEPSEPCTDWQDPAPGQGWPDFNNTFGGAPCDDGGGCPFNEIQAFQVWAGEAYAINNFIEGGTYTFSNCNGPGAGSWVPEFTVIAPSGAVDAFGSDTDCSITWTASESGTYLIVINEAGNCGDAFNTNNGWPAITCEGDGVACEGAVCETPSLVLDGPATICQDQTTTVDIPEPATFPDGGGIRLQFISTATGTGINLTLGGGLPYTFDYDLNGLLSANDIDPFEGEYTINIFLFTDAANIAGTICASGEDPVTVTFLGADDPLCEEPSPNCSASPLIIEGPAEICEGETVTLTGAVPPEIPAGGSMLYQFVNVDDDEDVINWTGAPFPATFDNDLNGLLSDNDFDPFSGTYEVEIFVYSNPGDIGNSTCAFGGAPVLITFLDANDPLCDGPPDPCSTAPLLALGSVIACEGESLTVAPNATFPPQVPEGGGIALVFAGGGLSSDFIISEVDFPFTFDADLNGALSGESLDPLSGDFEVEIVIYTDPTDVEGSICAEGTVPVGLTFAGPDHPDCVGEPEPCTDWQDPTPSTGYGNFNDLFGGAPCDPGTGCPVNEIITIEVWAGEAYSVDNFQEGGTYTFSICNGPGAFSWMPDFTIIAPSGAIDAFGSDTDCSITWTASESGTYLIVINQFGNCGEAVAENNGYPSLTCEGGPEVQCPETCDAGTLGVEGETALCPGDVTTVFNTEATEIPAAGGYRIRATAGGETYFFAPAAPDELTFIEYTFDGQAATPFVGTATLRAQVYSDADNPDGSICAESSDIELTFLADNAEDCTINSVLDWLSGDWSIYPNPAGHFVTVDLTVNSPLPIVLRITDISGRTVHTEVIAASSGRQEVRVETSQLASGIYMVSLEADNARDVKRLAVQH